MHVYIDFTRPKSFSIFSLGIRLVQRTPYSHVRIRFKFRDMTMVYEANGSNVRLLGPHAQQEQAAHIVHSYELKLSDAERDKALDLIRYSGTMYGFLQIVGILLTIIFPLKRNPFSDRQYTQICSELVGRFLEEVKGWKLTVDLDVAGPREIKQQLDEFCKTYPDQLRKIN